MFPPARQRLALSVVCLGSDRVQVAKALLDGGVVDELHLDYFPGGPPRSVGLRLAEVRELAEKSRPATIHFWGSAADAEAMGLIPRAELRIVVQISTAESVETAAVLAGQGWRVGWSIAATEWSETLTWLEHVRLPDHVQILSTTTPGFPGGTFAPSATDPLAHFSGRAVALSIDGGLTRETIVAMKQVGTVVLGSNFLGECVSPPSVDRLINSLRSATRER